MQRARYRGFHALGGGSRFFVTESAAVNDRHYLRRNFQFPNLLTRSSLRERTSIFTGSPDISSPSTAFKEMNAQWRGSASSQRGSARKNGGQWRSVRKGSKITPFTGFKGTKRQHFISDIHKSSRSAMETPPET
jgi:hypothetical protein